MTLCLSKASETWHARVFNVFDAFDVFDSYSAFIGMTT